MRILPTKIHGVADYLMGLVLMISPWLFGFADGTAAQWVPVILGAGMLLYSIFTRYELGLIKAIPMSGHLMLDVLGGLFLAASPWLFGFDDRVWVPHLVFGLLEVGAALMTRTTPELASDHHVGFGGRPSMT